MCEQGLPSLVAEFAYVPVAVTFLTAILVSHFVGHSSF